MIYCNFWFLKTANGMAYYGLDYVNELLNAGCELLLIKKRNMGLPIPDHQNLKVVDVNVWGFILAYAKILWFKCSVYSPTLHALPFVRHQVVTVHDEYPLTKPGFKKKINQFLFCLLLKSKRLHVATINFSIRKELSKYGISNYLYAPNFIPESKSTITKSVRRLKYPLRVGLVGTDSGKKDYDKLFSSFSLNSDPRSFEFFIYGDYNTYVKGIVECYSDLNIVFCQSSELDMNLFLENHVDVLVSIAKNEGFCRPVCSALQQNIVCLLIDDPVFKEFYEDFAQFVQNENDVVEKLMTLNFEPRIDRTKLNSFVQNHNKHFLDAVQNIRVQLSGFGR